MKINCKQTFKNLKGELINSVSQDGTEKELMTLGMMLADIVLNPHKNKNGFRPLKGYELAKKFYNQEEVEIDTADLIQLKELVENCEIYAPIIVAQTLEFLNEVKDSNKE